MGVHHRRSLERDIELRRIVQTAYDNVGFSQDDDVESLHADVESIVLPDPGEIPTVGSMQTISGPPSSTGAVYSRENLATGFFSCRGSNDSIIREAMGGRRHRHNAGRHEEIPLRNLGATRKYGTNIGPSSSSSQPTLPTPPTTPSSSLPTPDPHHIFEQM